MEVIDLCETFYLVPCLPSFVHRMVYSQHLDLRTVFVQMEEEFVSVKMEYETFEDQEALAKASDSDGEAETTALGPVSSVDQVDEMILACKGEENDLEPNHCPEGTILPQTVNVDSTTRALTVRIELSFEDKEEDAVIDIFITETCGCTLGPKKSPCSSQLSRDTITLTCNNCPQLTRNDADLVIMAQLTFSFVHAVGKEYLENLCKAVDSNGVVQRIHGNAKQPRHNQTPEAEVNRVRDFITTVGNTHGLPLPDRLPNSTEKILLLPSDMPKSKVYRDYKAVCDESGITPVGRSTFYTLWS